MTAGDNAMKKTIKTVLIILCAAAAAVTFLPDAKADIGPKPSVVVDFIGFEGKTYYVTLLSSAESTGPYSVPDISSLEALRYEEHDEEFDIFIKFAEYKDPDGFYFLQLFSDCTQTHSFRWTYYPPQEFKVLVYFPETDSFAVSSGSFERYAFDSYFTAGPDESSGINITLSIVKSYNYFGELLSLAVRIVLTIALEIAVALLFRLKDKKTLRFITVVNIVTQTALNASLNIINFRMGAMAFVICYILFEAVIFAAEALLYAFRLKDKDSKTKLVFYALSANAASFIFGILLAYWLPGIL